MYQATRPDPQAARHNSVNARYVLPKRRPAARTRNRAAFWSTRHWGVLSRTCMGSALLPRDEERRRCCRRLDQERLVVPSGPRLQPEGGGPGVLAGGGHLIGRLCDLGINFCCAVIELPAKVAAQCLGGSQADLTGDMVVWDAKSCQCFGHVAVC